MAQPELELRDVSLWEPMHVATAQVLPKQRDLESASSVPGKAPSTLDTYMVDLSLTTTLWGRCH